MNLIDAYCDEPLSRSPLVQTLSCRPLPSSIRVLSHDVSTVAGKLRRSQSQQRILRTYGATIFQLVKTKYSGTFENCDTLKLLLTHPTKLMRNKPIRSFLLAAFAVSLIVTPHLQTSADDVSDV
ncbi:MAG: hypothetical protein ACRCS9_07055 [Hyphomicrobium sp.]